MTSSAPEMPTQSLQTHDELISVVLPVYNESDNIQPCLRKLWAALCDLPHEILVCYDFDADTTLPAIEAMPDRPPTVRLVRNDLGRGVAFAMQAGFAAARGDVVVTTMADLSDPPEVIPDMARKVREHGAAVVSGSRYMPGGSQHGGPLLKRTLSRLAGISLHHIAGVGTHDATTNFRAYRADYLQSITVQSRSGFELALELTVKAHLRGEIIDEVPSTWHDRSAGQSRFQLWKWMPRYLHWYMQAMTIPALVWGVLLALLLLGLMSASTATAAAVATHRLAAVLLAAIAVLLVLTARHIRGRMSPLDLLFPAGAFIILLLPTATHYRLIAAAVLCTAGFVTLAIHHRSASRRSQATSRHFRIPHPAWIIAWIIGLPLVTFTNIPWLPRIIAEDGIDPSWMVALNHLFVAGFVYGEQIIFTFGPLGILWGGIYHPETFAVLLMGTAFLAVAIFLGVWRLARCSIMNHWLGGLVMLLMLALVAVAPRDVILIAPALLFILLHLKGSRKNTAVVLVLLPTAMAAVSLIKFSLFIGAAFLVALAAMDDIARRRFPWHALVYVAGIAGLWLLIGQPLRAFPAFFTTSLEISSGYTEAMSLRHPDHPYRGPVLYVSGAALLLGVITWIDLRRNNRRGIALILALAALLFLFFKAGFVRHDAHELIATGALIFFAAFYAIAYQRLVITWIERGLVTLAVAIALLTHAVGHATFDTSLMQRIREQADAVPKRMRAAMQLATDPLDLPIRYERAVERIRHSRTLPEVPGTIDVYPHSQALLIAHELNYAPRPVFQSYAAYTGLLAARNAAYLRRPDAPDHILLDIAPIDQRFPAMDDGLSWPELLTRYDIIDPNGTFLLLRRAPEPRSYALHHLSTRSINLGDAVELPQNGQAPIWATIRLHPTLARSASTFLYKSPEVLLHLRLADGRDMARRIVPSVAEAGFLISPMIMDRDGFVAFAGGVTGSYADERVTSISLQLAPGSPEMLGGSATVSFFELDFSPQDVRPALHELHIMKANVLHSDTPIDVMPNGPGGRRILGAHPTSRMALPVRPNAASIRIGFGILDGAWQRKPDTTDGVEFRIHSVSEDGATTLLWSRYLDPANRPADRGVQHIEVDFGSDRPDTLIFETLPGPTIFWDWAYWTDISFIRTESP